LTLSPFEKETEANDAPAEENTASAVSSATRNANNLFPFIARNIFIIVISLQDIDIV
jgi:hypothetical protein